MFICTSPLHLVLLPPPTAFRYESTLLINFQVYNWKETHLRFELISIRVHWNEKLMINASRWCLWPVFGFSSFVCQAEEEHYKGEGLRGENECVCLCVPLSKLCREAVLKTKEWARGPMWLFSPHFSNTLCFFTPRKESSQSWHK